MKVPTSICKWQNERLSIMKIMVLLWSTSVEKDSSIVPFFFFYLALFLAFPFFFFYLAFPFLAFLFFMGQCSINDDHHTSIYLQLNDYNSILEQNMTLYECLR